MSTTKLLIVIILIYISTPTFAENITVSNLKIESIGVAAVGTNKFILVSPPQTGCVGVGVSKMLFNSPSTAPNTSILYSTILGINIL